MLTDVNNLMQITFRSSLKPNTILSNYAFISDNQLGYNFKTKQSSINKSTIHKGIKRIIKIVDWSNSIVLIM